MEHYFSQNPQSASDRQVFKTEIGGRSFSFATDSSVFARGKLDYGTRLLLEACLDRAGSWQGRILDLGCGYGAIGIVLKKLNRQLEVSMLDINQRALLLARHNIGLNQLGAIELIHSDGLPESAGKFSVIISNPPIRAGKKTVYRLFAQAGAALLAGGWFYLVIQKKQGADSARRELAGLFTTVEIIARSRGYQVLACSH